MKATATKIRLQTNEDNQVELVLTLKENRLQVQKEAVELKGIIESGKQLVVEIKQYRQKRSLDANSYMWLLLSEMAAVMKTTKDELYLIMLERYGIFTHVVVKPNVVDKVKQEWRTVRELGEVNINGKTGIQLQCFFGSHLYDTKEFSVLLEGIISEAKDLGIEVISENEKHLLLVEWGK